MAKTITIPSDKGNPVFVVVNGRKYTYTAGETVSVPDEVAALLERNDEESVIYGRRTVAPLDPAVRYTGDGGAPVSVGDDGRLYADSVAAVGAIYVEGHKLIIPSEEG